MSEQTLIKKRNDKEQLAHEKKIRQRLHKEWSIEDIEDLGIMMIDWFMEDETRCFIGEFAAEHYLNRRQFPLFAERNEQFNKAHTLVKQIQETRLQKKGMDAKNAGFIIFMLKNVSDYTDRRETSIPELSGMGKLLADAAKRAVDGK